MNPSVARARGRSRSVRRTVVIIAVTVVALVAVCVTKLPHAFFEHTHDCIVPGPLGPEMRITHKHDDPEDFSIRYLHIDRLPPEPGESYLDGGGEDCLDHAYPNWRDVFDEQGMSREGRSRDPRPADAEPGALSIGGVQHG